MEKTATKRKLKMPQRIKKIIIELDKIDGKKLRQISSTDSAGTKPSLTITAELSDLKWKKGDWVLVGIEKDKIVIESPPIE